MPKVPQKPQHGQPVIKALYNSICDIIDYLPSLEVKGDQKSTYVTKSSVGTVIHATQPDTSFSVKSNKYFAGSGLVLTSGNVFNVNVDNSTVKIVDNKLSCVVSGGGGGGGTTILCGDFSYPNYFAMSDVELANVASFVPCGIGISWVLPVSANTRPCFYSTAGDGTAFGVFTSDVNEPNPQRIQMSNGVPVAPSTNGWCRISVFDSGNCAGSCLRFTSHFPAETPSYDYWNFTTPLYRFNGFKEFEPDSRTVFLCGGVLSSFEYTGVGDIVVNNQNHTISYDGSGGGGDVDLSWKTSYPDIQALRNGDYSNIAINGEYYTTSGQGISWLIPVQSGYNYKVYANNGDGKVWSTFASSLDVLEGQDERIDPIANGIAFAPSTDGWARISVFDDGSNEGECLRLFKYTDSDSGLEGMPLYRFHGFRKYTAGAGIDIESGIISCMIQPGQGLVSTALTAPGSNPYNPTITGYAFDLSTQFYNDLVTISGRTGNKVLSSSNGVLTWATNVAGGSDKFYAPNYAKLPTTDAGETALGLGTTYVVPVKSGNTIHYSSDGGVVVAQWLPCEGSSTAIKDVPTSTPYLTTTEDGFVRISVIDDGSLTYGCVRLHVGNKSLPLHKFARFSPTSGYTYTGERYINVKYTEERLNTTTNLVETVPLTNPIISCTLTGGNYVEIQQRDSNNNLLEFPRINCTLSEGEGIEITSAGVINCTKTSTLSTVFDLLQEGPNIKLTKLNNGKTQISGAAGGGGGGTIINNGIPWPNYENLSNYSTTVSVGTDYTAGPNGGWLRVSYKGRKISDCYGVKINGNAVGLYCTQWGVGLYEGEDEPVTVMSAAPTGTIGCTWLIPVPPKQRFYIEFPSDCTYAYFDSAKYTTSEVESDYALIKEYTQDAYESWYTTRSNTEDAWYWAEDLSSNWRDYQQSQDIDDLWSIGTYQSQWRDASGCAIEAETYAETTSGHADSVINQYNYMIEYNYDIMNEAIEYKTSAIALAEEAAAFATSAVQAAQKAYDYYLSACNAYHVTPEEY